MGIERIVLQAAESIEKLVTIDFRGRGSGLCLFFIVWTSQIGKIFRTISVNKALAASMGIPVTRYEVMSFATGCFFAALGGVY